MWRSALLSAGQQSGASVQSAVSSVANRSPVRFTVIGVVSFLTDTAFLTVLRSGLHVQLGIAAVLANAIGFGLNFLLNRIFSFDSRHAGSAGAQFAKWLAIFAGNLLATGAIVQSLGYLWSYYPISKIIATVLTSAANYFLFRSWVFRATPPRPVAEACAA